MALERGKLTDVVQVSAATTSAIITVASSKKVYVKSILAYSPTGTATTAHVYVVPNGGVVGEATKLFNVALNAHETALIEPSYPIVLDTTGDSLRVGAGSTTINFFITGDKEA